MIVWRGITGMVTIGMFGVDAAWWDKGATILAILS